MSEKTTIEWCDHTFNPWIGCTKVSPGCAQCYAETLMDKRYGRVKWGKGNPRSRTSAANWKLPLRWNRQRALAGVDVQIATSRPRVFCASLADWLDDEVPIEWLADLLALIHATPNLDWLLLTKRPELWRQRINAAGIQFRCYRGDVLMEKFCEAWIDDCVPANVWIGTSVEDQKRADERIPKLLEIPAKIRFLSAEPLLGPVNLDPWLGDVGGKRNGIIMGVNLVIIGGESGPKARLCDTEWIREIAAQCKAAGVATFVKQLGSSSGQTWSISPGHGRAMPIHDRKGGDPAEWPTDLRIREFPV